MLSILETLQELCPRLENSKEAGGEREGNACDGGVHGGLGNGRVDGDIANGDNGDTCSVGPGSRDDAYDDTNADDDYKDIKVQGILLGGDQLSTSTARCVISDRINSMNNIQSLKGIVPVVEDWHTKLCYLTVS